MDPPVVDTGSNSSGGFASFFGAESCSSRLFSFSLSFSKFPGFRSLMSRERFLHRTSISNLRLSCGKGFRVREGKMWRRFCIQSKYEVVDDKRAVGQERRWGTLRSCSWCSSARTFIMAMVQGFWGLKTYRDTHIRLSGYNEWIKMNSFVCLITNICLFTFWQWETELHKAAQPRSVTHHASETGLQDFGHKGNHIQKLLLTFHISFQ